MLAEHRRARSRRDDQIDPAHWHGLPDGSTRATTTQDSAPTQDRADERTGEQLAVVLTHRTKLATPVATRDMAVYDLAAGLTPTGTSTAAAAGGGR